MKELQFLLKKTYNLTNLAPIYKNSNNYAVFALMAALLPVTA
jgi:hypothetical protein